MMYLREGVHEGGCDTLVEMMMRGENQAEYRVLRTEDEVTKNEDEKSEPRKSLYTAYLFPVDCYGPSYFYNCEEGAIGVMDRHVDTAPSPLRTVEAVRLSVANLPYL